MAQEASSGMPCMFSKELAVLGGSWLLCVAIYLEAVIATDGRAAGQEGYTPKAQQAGRRAEGIVRVRPLSCLAARGGLCEPCPFQIEF